MPVDTKTRHKSEPTEDLSQWAERIAPTLKDEQWLNIEAEPVAATEVFAACRALLAYVEGLTRELTDEQADDMDHALGCDSGHRNHFVTDEGDEGWCSLAEQGLAKQRPYRGAPHSSVFHVTPLGRAVLRARERLG